MKARHYPGLRRGSAAYAAPDVPRVLVWAERFCLMSCLKNALADARIIFNPSEAAAPGLKKGWPTGWGVVGPLVCCLTNNTSEIDISLAIIFS